MGSEPTFKEANKVHQITNIKPLRKDVTHISRWLVVRVELLIAHTSRYRSRHRAYGAGDRVK